MSERDFKYRLKATFTSKVFIVSTILVSSAIMAWIGGPGFLLGLVIALLTFWLTGWDKNYFGLGKAGFAKSILPALAYTLLIILLNDLLTEPLVELTFQSEIDLRVFEDLRGNLVNLLIMILTMWALAAFGEEFFYRGYVMKSIAHITGNNETGWVLGLMLSSVIFGVVHAYQGITGVITTGIIGFILGVAFFRNRQNLLIAMLTHGIYDTYGLTMIYLEKESILKGWAMDNIYTSIF